VTTSSIECPQARRSGSLVALGLLVVADILKQSLLCRTAWLREILTPTVYGAARLTSSLDLGYL
jgi:hypothetical protein